MKDMIFPMLREEEEQMLLFRWAELHSGKRPELRLLFHIPNGGKRGKAEAARFKAQGVKAGVPDLLLPVPRCEYHGLFIELKRRKGGRVSEEQGYWLISLAAQGFRVEVCKGWEEARTVIENYLDTDCHGADGASQ